MDTKLPWLKVPLARRAVLLLVIGAVLGAITFLIRIALLLSGLGTGITVDAPANADLTVVIDTRREAIEVQRGAKHGFDLLGGGRHTVELLGRGSSVSYVFELPTPWTDIVTIEDVFVKRTVELEIPAACDSHLTTNSVENRGAIVAWLHINDRPREPLPQMQWKCAPLAPPSPPRVLPVIPLRNTVLFPNALLPLEVGRPATVAALADIPRDVASGGDGFVAVIAQRSAADETPGAKDLYEVGVVARVMKITKQADQSYQIVLAASNSRLRVKEVEQAEPFLGVTFELIPPGPESPECVALIASLREQLHQRVRGTPAAEVRDPWIDAVDGAGLVMFAYSGLDLASVNEKQLALETPALDAQLRGALTLLARPQQR